MVFVINPHNISDGYTSFHTPPPPIGSILAHSLPEKHLFSYHLWYSINPLKTLLKIIPKFISYTHIHTLTPYPRSKHTTPPRFPPLIPEADAMSSILLQAMLCSSSRSEKLIMAFNTQSMASCLDSTTFRVSKQQHQFIYLTTQTTQFISIYIYIMAFNTQSMASCLNNTTFRVSKTTSVHLFNDVNNTFY